MKRNLLFFFFLLFISQLMAQTTSVSDLYLAFSVERSEGSPVKALALGEKILAHPEKLPPAKQNNLIYHLGKLYEVNHEDEKAIPFYERVAAAVPDYYVAHLALGHLYLRSAKPLIQKINASKTNRAEYDLYWGQYKKILAAALPHLEKAQACDPNEDTLKALEYIYQSLKTPEKNASLEARLKPMAAGCISLLVD